MNLVRPFQDLALEEVFGNSALRFLFIVTFVIFGLAAFFFFLIIKTISKYFWLNFHYTELVYICFFFSPSSIQ